MLWRARWMRLAVVVAALAAVVILTPRRPLPGDPLSLAEQLTTRAAAFVIHASGSDVRREGIVLSHPSGFAMEIYWRCTGALPVMFLVGLVAATPAPRARKVAGAVTGSAVILAGNLLRLAVLFDIGVRQPALFATAHEVGGEVFTVLLVFATWRIWMHWAERGLPPREAMAT